MPHSSRTPTVPRLNPTLDGGTGGGGGGTARVCTRVQKHCSAQCLSASLHVRSRNTTKRARAHRHTHSGGEWQFGAAAKSIVHFPRPIQRAGRPLVPHGHRPDLQRRDHCPFPSAQATGPGPSSMTRLRIPLLRWRPFVRQHKRCVPNPSWKCHRTGDASTQTLNQTKSRAADALKGHIPPPPPPCANTAAVPKVQTKPRSTPTPCVDKPVLERNTHTSKARYLTTMPGIAMLAMTENHITANRMGLPCVVQCCYEQNAPSQT